MDCIYATHGDVQLGVLPAFDLDMAFGSDENDYELKTGLEPELSAGMLVYIEETEFGGIIDRRHVDETGSEVEVSYSGRTWHGILDAKVIEPPAGQAYRTYSGDANDVVRSVVAGAGLSDLFEVSGDAAASISGRFNRYATVWKGLVRELNRHGMRLEIVKPAGRKVMLSAVPAADYSGEFYSDKYSFKLDEEMRHVNHLVCLGKGELTAREVVHLYADEDGNVSRTQTLFGTDERAKVYSNTNATEHPEGDEETLTQLGTKELLALQGASEIEVQIAEELPCKIGDTIGGHSVNTPASVVGTVSKVILRADSDGEVSLQYEVGKLIEEEGESL